jgi:hypothetical protein
MSCHGVETESPDQHNLLLIEWTMWQGAVICQDVEQCSKEQLTQQDHETNVGHSERHFVDM